MSRARARRHEVIPFAPRIEWPELVNIASPAPHEVQLIDGRVVDSKSAEWRAECEARHVLRMPTKLGRLDYLNRVQARRGQAARDSLHAAVMGLWQALRHRQDDGD